MAQGLLKVAGFSIVCELAKPKSTVDESVHYLRLHREEQAFESDRVEA